VIFLDALWSVVAAIMFALLYRKSVGVATHDKVSFFKMLVVWVLALLLVYNIDDWTLDHMSKNLRVPSGLM
jgi:hypothetical protein